MTMPMEDCNMLVADCIAISCCTQCLILQIIIFVLLKLPCKLIRKTKEYAKKKLGPGRKQQEEKMMNIKATDERGVKGGLIQDEDVKLIQGFSAAQVHGLQRCCMKDAEKVLDELSQKGEFAFGSFWGRSYESETSGVVISSSPNQRYDFVHYEFIGIASFSS